MFPKFGSKYIEVGDIPYSSVWGSKNQPQNITLERFITSVMHENDMPLYMFQNHAVPSESESRDSLVAREIIGPVHPSIFGAFDFHSTRSPTKKVEQEAHPGSSSYNFNVDMNRWLAMEQSRQFAFGSLKSGSPVHFHATSLLQLFYGMKKWYFFPPSKSFFSKQHVMDWLDKSKEAQEERLNSCPSDAIDGTAGEFYPTACSLQCVQYPGDLIIVPERWGHGVVNLKSSIVLPGMNNI